MAYFPMFVDLKDQPCVIVGGGRIAYRKVLSLLDFEAKIRIIAANVKNEIKKLKEGGSPIEIIERGYCPEDIREAFLVIAATDDMELNKQVAADCRAAKIPVNVVDTQEECGFIFPAYIRRGAVTVGITSSGKSPVMTQRIKKLVDKNLPEYTALLTENLGKARECVKEEFKTEAERKRVYERLADFGAERDGKISYEDRSRIMDEMKNS